MGKPRLLDTYCGSGGVGKGYADAGFEVYGVDNNPQPLRHYPFPHVCADALEVLGKLLRGEGITFSNGETLYLADFAAIHASPPCQFVTRAGAQWRQAGREYPDLIGPTREALKATGRPYIIENVPGAPLVNPIILNGALFGLRVKRDRLFETSFPLPALLLPLQERPRNTGRPFDARRPGTFWPVGHFSGVKEAREAMGISWMNRAELTQAIPPVYCEFIGRYLLHNIA